MPPSNTASKFLGNTEMARASLATSGLVLTKASIGLKAAEIPCTWLPALTDLELFINFALGIRNDCTHQRSAKNYMRTWEAQKQLFYAWASSPAVWDKLAGKKGEKKKEISGNFPPPQIPH